MISFILKKVDLLPEENRSTLQNMLNTFEFVPASYYLPTDVNYYALHIFLISIYNLN